MEIKLDSTYKGTRILFMDKAKNKRGLLNKMIDIVESYGYKEIMIPIIQKQETFLSKVGDENPKAGRYRQFTQFGVEVLNPSKDYSDEMVEIAKKLIEIVTTNYEVNTDVTRGLDYYKDGKGFEIACPELGSSKQVCGGGSYEGGVGFAVGIDRILLCK